MDPVDFEASLDRLHSPQDAWRLLVEFSAGCRVRRIGEVRLFAPATRD